MFQARFRCVCGLFGAFYVFEERLRGVVCVLGALAARRVGDVFEVRLSCVRSVFGVFEICLRCVLRMFAAQCVSGVFEVCLRCV